MELILKRPAVITGRVEISRSFTRGKNPNSRNGFKKGHPSYDGCGAPKGSHNSPSTQFKAGASSPFKGVKLSLEHRAKMSAAKKGKPAPHKAKENSPFWKGGITPINMAFRMSREYAEWRSKVFARDNYTCVECHEAGVKIEADHIKPFSMYPELRLDISNGRTLCAPCHRKTDTFGRKLKANAK